MSTELEESIFDSLQDPFAVRRRDMIPKWIRFFCWLFAIVGTGGAVIGLIGLFTNTGGPYSIYGFSSSQGLSIIGLVTVGLFALKGIAAIGLLNEKDWAVNLAIADGAIGIVICIYSQIFTPLTTEMINGSFTAQHLNLRLEILFLIPYLMKMIKIRRDWEENTFVKQQTTGSVF